MQNRILNNTFFGCVVSQWLVLGLCSFFFPGMTVGNGIALFSLAAIATAVPAYTCLQGRGVQIFMAAVCCLLGIGVILNSWFYTTCLGGSPSHPVLINQDCLRWWSYALFYLGKAPADVYASHGFYGYVLAGVLWLFGTSVGAALLWSMTLILTALMLTGILTFKLTNDKTTALVSMIATASVCYWLTMGTLILKDAFIFVAFLVGALGLLESDGKRYLYLIALAALMLAVARPSYILLLIVGMAFLSVGRFKWRTIAVSVVICLVLWSIPIVYGQLADIGIALTASDKMGFTFDRPNQLALHNMIGNYPDLPLYKKILILPLSAAVQFFIPFVWTMARDIPFGLTEVWAHIGFPWYLFGFLAVYFFIAEIRRFNSPVVRLTAWAILCWLVPCFLFGGTVSRYGLPFVALLAPAVALAVTNYRRSKRFYVIGALYIGVVTAVLIVAYHLQSSAMQ